MSWVVVYVYIYGLVVVVYVYTGLGLCIKQAVFMYSCWYYVYLYVSW